MKKVLLTTTAMAFAASIGSAGDMSMSGSISLTYGAFGTGSAVGGTDDFTPEADLDIAASSSGGNISMSGTLEIDEDGAPDVGPIAISTGALTLTYDTNDMGALARTNAADGEDDNYGDYSIAFSAGGIGVTYTKDQESSDNAMAVTYSTGGALSLRMTALDERQANASAGLVAGAQTTTVGATIQPVHTLLTFQE